jgi:hypothetical protein
MDFDKESRMSEEVHFQLLGGPSDIVKVYTTHTDTVYEIRIDVLFRGEDTDLYGFQGYVVSSLGGHANDEAIRCNLATVWGYINTEARTGWLKFL